MLTTQANAATDGTVETLRAFIEAGRFASGDRLPPERELMVELGVTRTALRKALDRLEHEGRIWRHVGKGTFIASEAGSDRPGRLSELSNRVTPYQMMRARLSLEPSIAREAAINASDAEVRKITAARDGATRASDWDAYEAEDDAFHRRIAEATGNVLLLDLFDQLNTVRRAVAWNTVTRQSTRPSREHASFVEHDRIVDAIVSRDPSEAFAAMRDHLNSVSTRLFGEA